MRGLTRIALFSFVFGGQGKYASHKLKANTDDFGAFDRVVKGEILKKIKKRKFPEVFSCLVY